jgi:hypothetical protein
MIGRALLRPNANGRARLEGLLEEAEGVLGNIAEQRLVPFFGEARPVVSRRL